MNKDMRLYIRELKPTSKSKYVSTTIDGWFKDIFFDPELHIMFHVFNEPSWLHMEKDVTYSFEFETENSDSFKWFRLWKRFGEYVIIAEYHDDDWDKIDNEELIAMVHEDNKIKIDEYKGR